MRTLRPKFGRKVEVDGPPRNQSRPQNPFRELRVFEGWRSRRGGWRGRLKDAMKGKQRHLEVLWFPM